MMGPTEFAQLVDAHGPALQLYARQWCDVPEDIVQDAFVKLFTARPGPTDVAAWLYRVVRNAAMDAAKTSRRRKKREAAAARPEPWFAQDQAGGLDAKQAIVALQALPIDEREAIVAHLWGGLSFEQIGAVADCSASTAFRRFSKGIEQLRKTLEAPCPTQPSNS